MKIRLLLSTVMPVVLADTCLSQPQLAGIIFGSVAASLLLAGTVAVVMWWCMKSKSDSIKTEDKCAYTNPVCDVEEKGCDAPKKLSQKDQMTMIDSFKLRRKVLDTGTQKYFSTEHINEVDGQVGVQLKSEDLGGLGFNIQGNMKDGIFVKAIQPKGPAELCGNILSGDRIKSLTISFEEMVYEDAVTILSYASPYRVKLELERKLSESPVPETETGSPRLHPLFRSNTLTNIHFKPVSCQAARCASVETTQKHALPAVVSEPEKPATPEPVTEPEPVSSPVITEQISQKEESKSKSDSSPTPDSTTWNENGTDGDISKMESSDYASDNTSDYRESLSDGASSEEVTSSSEPSSQHTISDRMEITDVIVDKPMVSPVPAPTKIEYCAALPPKPQKIVSRSPSPKMVRRTPTPPAVAPQPSPAPSPKVEKVEVVMPSPPVQSNIPVKREPTKSRIPPPSPSRAPEITEARVSRIPKRTESIKTPVLERKLPSLPRSVTQRSHSAEDKNSAENVWSRLYQEKKGNLRKVRDQSAGPSVSGSLSPVSPTSSSPQPVRSPKIQRTPSSDRYGTLSRDRRDKLAANQEVLDRQKEELRQLGIM